MIDEKWLATCLSNQKNRVALLGDSMNPLARKAERYQRDMRKKIEKGSVVENIDPIISTNKPPSVPSVPTSVASPSVSPLSVVLPTAALSPRSSEWLSARAEHKKKDKDKKPKKHKKKQRRLMETLSDNLIDADTRTGNLLAETVKCSGNIVLVNDELWSYHDDTGCFHRSSYNEIATELRASLDFDDALKISTRDYKECVEQLLISEEIAHKDGFFENNPYVCCLNGVVDVCEKKLLDKSPQWMFKHCIQANYLPSSKCPNFMEYVDHITDGDKELKRLLRVLIGYIASHYNNGKIAVLLYGIPHTGKSVFCNLIARILGDESLSYVDLSMLQRQEYVASLSGKLLNIAPDLKNETLKDVGFFKSLVSHDDKIAARSLYSNPTTIKCETKMLFSTNHLLSFDSSLGVYDIEAVFNRLIFFPFQNKPISSSQENKHLSELLYEEKDAIFTWAMEGLRDYVKNNEQFPKSKLSEEIKSLNMARYCPEKMFFQTCLKRGDGKYESVTAIKEAYKNFCQKADVKHMGNIASFLKEHEKLEESKTRIDEDGFKTSRGGPIWVFEGIRLRNKYRPKGVIHET